MNTRIKVLIVVGILWGALSIFFIPSYAEEPKFTMIALGVSGGLEEGNLPSYLLAQAGSHDFIALDAGTLLTGLQQAKIAGNLDDIRTESSAVLQQADAKENATDVSVSAAPPLQIESYVMQQHIKAYLISHPHLDHIAGLIINSPDDGAKPIFGLPSTLDTLRDHAFNWKLWSNFGNDGEGFQLKKYEYVRVTPDQEVAIAGTPLNVTPFELCHSGVTSTAFLVRTQDDYALYFGDTGPDDAEKCEKLQHVWQTIAPLVREKKLRGIFLESSYPDPRDAKQLFGHLTPAWMMKELRRLAEAVDPQQPATALKGLFVMVTHIKPSLQADTPRRDVIKKQLEEANDLGITFAFPEQGDRIEF
ncbi:3',5'-cyclic-nucleotide phosphodiesterase [Candidatus Moduliflexus flocculans]|uniref:3',5'-cyclic-nucleotide phosphodiesterase n=1 Tax=Candidatus Moduliflexus flocculans TaxID=1499966 RepID=A0A0S6VW82_9BACT|nr:3',5'-cyclic-nucleotide phosphodiesterase [Candidatus Moduliflexus flocculans]